MTEQAANLPERLPPSVLVIFGASGNLAKHKLFPALYELLKYGHTPEHFVVVPVFRQTSADLDDVLEQTEIHLLREKGECDTAVLERLRAMMRPITMDSTNQDDFYRLRDMLSGIDAESGVASQYLFYLAIPPEIFQTVIGCLAGAGLQDESAGMARRIFVEKPFGSDLQSAKELVDSISQHFSERQIYRIDHYLAKETAQNILTFRFNNPIIEDVWGRQCIDHIQITAAEKIDIEGRAGFYESMGALRDIVQSHLLQLLALMLMEAPQELNSQGIHAEKLAALRSIQPLQPGHITEQVVRGQYESYREEVNNPSTTTETYVALKLEVANSRWGGVPVLLRTGKAVDEKCTEIHVVFKDRSRRNSPDNVLTMRIQPNEGIALTMSAKKPGFNGKTQPVVMNFDYHSAFGGLNPDAYERVLNDAIAGDQSLFASSEEVLRCWEILEPLLEACKHGDLPLHSYQKGSAGPLEADKLAHDLGLKWL